MPRALLLGSNGLLGSTLVVEFQKAGIDFRATTRSGMLVHGFKTEAFSLENDDISALIKKLGPFEYVINCLGMISHKINQTSMESVKKAIHSNSLFPHQLDYLGKDFGFQVINIATDCVFDGKKGGYSENSSHSPNDIYGVSKSLGEVNSENTLNLRCSIVGMEYNSALSLMSWLLSQPKGSLINGYSNHFWNGITTDTYANLIIGIMNQSKKYFGVRHFIPKDSVSKYELLRIIAKAANRYDLRIQPEQNEKSVDRRLITIDTNYNEMLWELTNFKTAPRIEEMIFNYLDKPYLKEFLLRAKKESNDGVRNV